MRPAAAPACCGATSRISTRAPPPPWRSSCAPAPTAISSARCGSPPATTTIPPTTRGTSTVEISGGSVAAVSASSGDGSGSGGGGRLEFWMLGLLALLALRRYTALKIRCHPVARRRRRPLESVRIANRPWGNYGQTRYARHARMAILLLCAGRVRCAAAAADQRRLRAAGRQPQDHRHAPGYRRGLAHGGRTARAA